jgi:Icc-related predicted phosphoesterase
MFRIFFASDVHGSDVVFRKFLNAGNYYKADALIFGGDITGKALIFVEKDRDGNYQADFLGVHETAKGEEQFATLIRRMIDRGYYYRIMETSEIERVMQDKDEMQRIMLEEMVKRIEIWLDLAKKLYVGTNKRVYLLVGNDDPKEIQDTIGKYANENIVDVNDKRFTLDVGNEGFGLPFSNMTPWKLPGDITEEELERKIDGFATTLKDTKTSIFLIHVPPYNTAIDEAPLLQDLKMQVNVTGIQTTHVGSTAVRTAIVKYEPMLSLNGHIHESRGIARIGKTLCINPGSEYEQGVLRGAVINIDDRSRKLKSYLLVSG